MNTGKYNVYHSHKDGNVTLTTYTSKSKAIEQARMDKQDDIEYGYIKCTMVDNKHGKETRTLWEV